MKMSGCVYRSSISAFLNGSAVVNVLKEEEKEIVLVCAGWKGRLAFEDILLAGKIIHMLNGGTLSDDATDGARVAFGLYEIYGNDIPKVIHMSNHATRLKNIAGTDDLDYCSQVDIIDIVPRLKEGRSEERRVGK